MSKVSINESTLTSIGNAIRAKTGKSELIAPLNMPDEINAIETGGGDLPEEVFSITGECHYRFAYDGWNWFIENYGNKITTENITGAMSMFENSRALEAIPFDLNCTTSALSCTKMFNLCEKLKSIGAVRNLQPTNMASFFASCKNLRELPVFESFNGNYLHAATGASMNNMFDNCFSLRSIPESFLETLYSKSKTTSFGLYYYGFSYCVALDEVRGLKAMFDLNNSALSSNSFTNTFRYCGRLKNIIFASQEDGTPYDVMWKSQTIDLTTEVGYASSSATYMLNNNSGITADKEVKDDATYQALKDDPDWFTRNIAYSRYNHDSAVNTINSLPDASAYLATAGGTNTIKFKGAAGSATDGGAINTLTEAEIAVAAAKGWTVTLA